MGRIRIRTRRWLHGWRAGLAASADVQTLTIKRRHGKRTETYRFVNQVPLRDTGDAPMVSWCELTTTRADGKVLITTPLPPITRSLPPMRPRSSVPVALAGRWRTSTTTPCKTKGYHLTRNFGHGKQHLAALLATINLLAFLFRTLLELLDSSYHRLRQVLPRRTFFDDLRALTRYLCFESWEALIAFVTKGLELQAPDTS